MTAAERLDDALATHDALAAALRRWWETPTPAGERRRLAVERNDGTEALVREDPWFDIKKSERGAAEELADQVLAAARHADGACRIALEGPNGSVELRRASAARTAADVATALRTWATPSLRRRHLSVTSAWDEKVVRAWEFAAGSAIDVATLAAEVIEAASAHRRLAGRDDVYRVRVGKRHQFDLVLEDARAKLARDGFQVARGLLPALFDEDATPRQRAEESNGPVPVRVGDFKTWSLGSGISWPTRTDFDEAAARAEALAKACEAARAWLAGLDLMSLTDEAEAVADMRHRLRAPSVDALEAAVGLVSDLHPARQGQAEVLNSLMAASAVVGRGSMRADIAGHEEAQSVTVDVAPPLSRGLTWEQIRELAKYQ